MTARRAGRGFSLLEVMVALAILATSLLAVSDVVAGALRNHVRARHVETAALLARAKMVQLEEKYEAKGFAATDESDDGSFEDEGHAEVKWKLEVVAPPQSLDGDLVVRALTGMDVKEFLSNVIPSPDQAPELASFLPMLTAGFQQLSGQLGENVRKGLRELRLTVSWSENGREESFLVKTHMLVLAPGELGPQ